MNHLDSSKLFDDANSRRMFESLSGKVMHVPVEAKGQITDLSNPQLTLDSRIRMDLRNLNHQTDTSQLKFLSGSVAVDLQYQGPLKEYLDSIRTSYRGKLNGVVTLTNGSADLRSQQKKFDEVNLYVKFTEKNMNLDSRTVVVPYGAFFWDETRKHLMINTSGTSEASTWPEYNST